MLKSIDSARVSKNGYLSTGQLRTLQTATDKILIKNYVNIAVISLYIFNMDFIYGFKQK